MRGIDLKFKYLIVLVICFFSFCSITCNPTEDLQAVSISVEPEKTVYKVGEVLKISFAGTIDKTLYDNACLDLRIGYIGEHSDEPFIYIQESDELEYTPYQSEKKYLTYEEYDDFQKEYFVYTTLPGDYVFNLYVYAHAREKSKKSSDGQIGYTYELKFAE